MRTYSARTGFTLIELLTVIAIIAVLAAILFPLAGTVREQSRAGGCMSNLHQLYVAASVYREDEGVYPSALFGYAETTVPCPTPQNPNATIRAPWVGGAGLLPADGMAGGFLYRELVKDIGSFKCPNNTPQTKTRTTIAYYPNVQTADSSAPNYWPHLWIGDMLKAKGCPSDAFGTVDCFWEIPANHPCLGYLHNQPRIYYTWDSYDIGPAVDLTGRPVLDAAGNQFYVKHYSTDWSGIRGANDYVGQMKYQSPPADETLLTYCTWHAATARSNTAPGITISGTARKVNLKRAVALGPRMFTP